MLRLEYRECRTRTFQAQDVGVCLSVGSTSLTQGYSQVPSLGKTYHLLLVGRCLLMPWQTEHAPSLLEVCGIIDSLTVASFPIGAVSFFVTTWQNILVHGKAERRHG